MLELIRRAEASARDISRAEKPEGFTESKRAAKRGGSVAGVTRETLETETGQSVVTAQNAAQMGAVVTELIEALASADEKNDARGIVPNGRRPLRVRYRSLIAFSSVFLS